MLIGILTYFEPRVAICTNLCQSPGTRAILPWTVVLGLVPSQSDYHRPEAALEPQIQASRQRQLRPRNPTGVCEAS